MKARYLLLAVALGTGCAQAQAPGAGTSPAGGQVAPASDKHKLARGDRNFIDDAASSGMFEVQIGQLAASKATDLNVKNFANMLVDQHKAANNELVKIATAKGVELPAAPKHSLRREIDKLGKKNGEEFDRDFVREVGIKAHQKDIRMFERARKDVKDADLRAWVDKTLPTLREHLVMAEKLPQSGKNAATMGANKR